MKYFGMFALALAMTVSFYAKADATCTEGSQEMVLEDDGSGEHLNPVLYVCHGGVYVKANALRSNAKDAACVEGAQETFYVDDGSGEHMNQVLFVCHNGVFVPAN